MEALEIRKVANGYLVVPAYNPGRYTESSQTHVFPTFVEAAQWMRSQFEPVSKA